MKKTSLCQRFPLQKTYLLFLYLLTFSCATEDNIHPPIEKSFQEIFDIILLYSRETKISPDIFRYDWEDGVYVNSIIRLYKSGIDTINNLNYLKQIGDLSLNKANGAIPNQMIPGVVFPFLYEELNDQRYLVAAEKIYNDYKNIPKSKNGATSHTINEVQLWDDTIYMTGTFLLQMFEMSGDTIYLQDYIKEISGHYEHLNDPNEHLWYHAWDEDGIDNRSFQTGSVDGWTSIDDKNSDEFWARGNGWVLMGICDILPHIPTTHPNYPFLVDVYFNMLYSLSLYQDNITGHWFNIINKANYTRNFIESSSTMMYAYSILSLINSGTINSSKWLLDVVDDSYNGLQQISIKNEGDLWLITNVCGGSSVGNQEYYFNRPIVSNTNFSLGLFLMYSAEVLKYHKTRF